MGEVAETCGAVDTEGVEGDNDEEVIIETSIKRK